MRLLARRKNEVGVLLKPYMRRLGIKFGWFILVRNNLREYWRSTQLWELNKEFIRVCDV